MRHPLLFILGGEEFRTPELVQALQSRGWDAKWLGSADAVAMGEEGLSPSALVVNSGRGDASMQAVRAFRDRDAMLPLILVGENAMGFPIAVDAHIPQGSAPESWLATLGPFFQAFQTEDEPAQSEAEDALEPFGKYRLKRKVAQGGAADIYEARQVEPQGFSRALAIKMLREQHRQDPARIKALLDEANLAAVLDHQNIARVFDFGIESGRHYIAMEYVEGGNLRSIMEKARAGGAAFPEPIAAHVIAQAASALDYAHRRRDREGQPLGLVHRDVSPHNILVDAEGTVKLIDFGIAKSADPARGAAGAAVLQGKLLYMSPEQALGAAMDHRSDIYSLGLVLFEMLTLRRCFDADDELGLMDSIRTAAVPDIRAVRRDTSRPMARILDRALQKSASDRYGSASEMARDLAAYLDHLGLESVEDDAAAFLRALDSPGAQAKVFVSSRFLPVRSDFALPSEKAKKHPAKAKDKKQRGRPNWVLPVVGLLLALLAFLLWVSVNA
jgi:serine/threonine protein kinase